MTRTEILEQIAEAAFEMAGLWNPYGTTTWGNGTVGDFRRVHSRILELQGELER